jgi:AbrB family looped-hinge helix DNA binding protein
MSSIAKIQHKGQVTIPTRLRNKAGLAKGDLVEFSFQRGKIVITPKVVVDRSKFPTADDEYTPAQRRIIDARLAKSAEDFRKGRTFSPFDTADEMVASMKKELKKRAASKQSQHAR